MADTTPYSVPQQPGRWRAVALAVAMHAALLAFFWIGIRWQNETPIAIEAEVWDMQARDAAPKQAEPPPEPPKPEPQPEPQPEHKSPPEPERQVASKPEPKSAVKEPAEKPDIALEQEKKKKEKAKREEEERLERQARLKEEKEQAEREKKAQAEKEKKALAEKEKKEQAEKEKKEKAEKEKKEQAKKEKEKQLAQEKEKAELEKQKAERAKKEKAEAERKRQEAQEAKLLAAMRKDAQKSFAGTAGSGGTGSAAKSQGPRGDPSYAAKVAAKIKSNTAFVVPSDLQGNPAVEYDVQLFPDGSLRGAPRKVKSSGIPAFDEAVRRAIELSAPYPADKSGTVPSGFPVIHRPKEQ